MGHGSALCKLLITITFNHCSTFLKCCKWSTRTNMLMTCKLSDFHGRKYAPNTFSSEHSLVHNLSGLSSILKAGSLSVAKPRVCGCAIYVQYCFMVFGVIQITSINVNRRLNVTDICVGYVL